MIISGTLRITESISKFKVINDRYSGIQDSIQPIFIFIVLWEPDYSSSRLFFLGHCYNVTSFLPSAKIFSRIRTSPIGTCETGFKGAPSAGVHKGVHAEKLLSDLRGKSTLLFNLENAFLPEQYRKDKSIFKGKNFTPPDVCANNELRSNIRKHIIMSDFGLEGPGINVDDWPESSSVSIIPSNLLGGGRGSLLQ
ncbi:hypothetical protein K501DRAFT_265564 [Backusella circina FSU 941]|nr:hypothetical protein K501DRAFT_265564 [Backusella circina FSU 941]